MSRQVTAYRVTPPPGHAEEHSGWPPGPAAPADGPDRAGDAGGEAQREEAGGRPALRDPAHRQGHERALPQQGAGQAQSHTLLVYV